MFSDNRKFYESPDFLLTEFEIDDIISSISQAGPGDPGDGVIPAW
jgi:hypothetical protein